MGNFLESVIEKFIRDGIVTEEELKTRIEDFKNNSIITDLVDENASLLLQNAMNEMKLESLEEDNATILLTIAGGM